MLVFIISSVNAVSLNSGVILNTSVSNSTMTFTTCSITAEQVNIDPKSIYLLNPEYSSLSHEYGEHYRLPASINYTTNNANIDCGSLGGRFGKEVFSYFYQSVSFILDLIPIVGIILIYVIFRGIYSRKINIKIGIGMIVAVPIIMYAFDRILNLVLNVI